MLRDKLAAAEIPAAEVRGYVTPRRLTVIAEGDSRSAAGSLRGAARTARRGAGAGNRGLSALGRDRLDRGMRDPRHRQGRVLFRDDQPTGPAGRRGVAGAGKVGDLRAAVAQIDALSGLVPALGSAADVGRLFCSRAKSCLCRSTGFRSDGSLEVTVSCRRARFASPTRLNTLNASASPASYWIRNAARKSSGRISKRPLRTRGLYSNQIPGCSTRSPGSWSFRLCSPAQSTPSTWRFRRKSWRPRCARIRNISPVCTPTARPLQDFCSSPTTSPRIMARRSSRAMSEYCGRGSPMRAFSGIRTGAFRSRAASRFCRSGSFTPSSAACFDKVARMERLAEFLADYVPGADRERSRRAVQLAKADLSTGMVGEFPELQGIIGRYYALHDGEDRAVADAIAEHYRPAGPNDACPTAPDQHCCGPGRQDRFSRRLLLDRRKADRVARSVRAAPGGARHHPADCRERFAPATCSRLHSTLTRHWDRMFRTRPASSSILSPNACAFICASKGSATI